MRSLWKDMLVAVWLGVIIPGIVLNGIVLKERQAGEEPKPLSLTDKTLVQRLILVRDPEGTVTEMDLDAYLSGVLLAEIPGEFHTEALKAQSVAARTYTWKAFTTGGKHGDHSVCTDSACCQAYIPEEVYLSRGGTVENQEKVSGAVSATSGFVLYHDGALIEATYFSSAGGHTEAAADVWGADFPYLQAVSSPEEIRSHEVIYTAGEFENLLGVNLSGDCENWFGAVSYTEGGGVGTMEIGGTIYSGTQLRSALRLKSTDFQMHPEGERIRITTQGYGHRVGMSQYGANAMAEAGSTWQQILQHYYPGTILAPLEEIRRNPG